MRTVTFSKPSLAKAMNDSFVCAWFNRQAEKKFRDGAFTHPPKSVVPRPGEAASNVTSIFAASDGTVLHAVPGYLGPTAFAIEVDFALALHERMYPDGDHSEQAEMIYKAAHKEAVGEGAGGYSGPSHYLLAGMPLVDVKRFGTDFFADITRPFCGKRMKRD